MQLRAKESFTQLVREAARKTTDQFTAEDLREALSLQTYPDRKRVRTVIQELRKSGEFKSLAPGVYAYRGNGQEGWGSGVVERVCQAMYLKGVFKARDIAVIANAELSSVNRIIRRLRKAGHLRHTGKAPGPKGQPVQTYSVVHRDRFYLGLLK